MPFEDGSCACAPTDVKEDSCKNARIDPDDDTQVDTGACYPGDYVCTYNTVPCGIVVRHNRACDEAGSRSVQAEFPLKPPCTGNETVCTDTNGGQWPPAP